MLRPFLVVVMLASSAAAAPPTPEELGAAELEKQARADWKAGRHDLAISKFAAAEKLSPTAVYAYNLAYALAERGRWSESMSALERAESYGVEDKHRVYIDSLTERVVGKLLASGMARLELTVSPPGATVRRNDRPWSPPWVLFTSDAQSTLDVSLDGHQPLNTTWTHAPGARPRLSLTLKKEGTPRPEPAPKPEPAPIPEPAPKPEPDTRSEPAPKPEPAPVLEVDVPISEQKLTGWVSLSAGVLTLAGGLTMLGISESLASDLSALGDSPGDLKATGSYEAYSRRFEADMVRRDDHWTAGWALVGIGGALTTTAILLLLLPDEAVVPVPGGAVVRF